MSIELRFYRERYNMEPSYYTGTEDVYERHFYPDIETLCDCWASLMRFMEGETYSAWSDGHLLCGGACDPDDIDIITENINRGNALISLCKEDTNVGTDNWYGIPEMTIEQEINLPPLAKRTIQNKIKIIDWCDFMEQAVNTIRNRAKDAPVKDDAIHSDLMQKWALMVVQTSRMLDDCAEFGKR